MFRLYNRHRVLTDCCLITAAVASFLFIATIIRLAVDKVAHFEAIDFLAQKTTISNFQPIIDVLFTGPSYINSGVIPPVFDDEISRLGYPIRSFNDAVGGLGIIEIEYTIDVAIEQKHCCKYVFITPSFSLFNIAADSDNIRSINFMTISHAWEEYAFMSTTPSLPRETISRSEYLKNIIKSTLRHYTNLGIVADLNVPKIKLWKPGERGYFPLFTKKLEQNYQDILTEIHNKRPGFVARAATDRQPAGDVRISPEMMDDIIGFGRKLEARGVVPLFLMAPETNYWDWDADFSTKFLARCGGSHLFDYNDPMKYPQLFAADVRYDIGHLNDSGAHVWSELIARDMAQRLRDGELTGPFCGT